jgi:tetratricopeptide (TPR) repeat protein
VSDPQKPQPGKPAPTTPATEPTATAFLDVLEKKGLVSGGVLATLRKQVAESKSPIPARRVAKLLVEKKALTPAIAQQLLAAASKPASGGSPAPAAKGAQPKQASKEPAAADPGVASLLDEELPPLPAGLPPLAASPLDALASDPSLAAAVGEGSPLGPPTAPKKNLFQSFSRRLPSGGRRRRRKIPWIWIGAAAAVLLLLVVVTVWLLNRPNPEALLDPADALYQKGSYAEAIEGYDRFLSYFSRHARSGRARVRRGLAELRLALDERIISSAALETAKQVLPAIGPEAEFDAEAGPILVVMLPRAAESLALAARERPAPEPIAQAQEMLSLADRYLPAAGKPLERLGRIEASLALTRHKIAGDDEQRKATAAIGQAVAAKKFAEAYRVRNALLDAYPNLSHHAGLTDAVLKIALAEQAAVAWVAKPEPAGKVQPAGPPSTVVLASRTFNSNAPDAEGRVVFAAAAGAVYALDAADGKVLWRKYVGFNPLRPGDADLPGAVAPQPGSDVVLAAASHREIQRLEAATGRTGWRHPLDDDFSAEPVVADGRVLVATLGGRLVAIDAATGNSPGFVQLPQPLPIAPAVDPRRKLVFQLADHDNLFVLAMPDWKCRQVFPLGHGPGAIAAPPIVFGDYLLVAVNDTAADSSLRVLGIESGTGSFRLAQTIPLKGHVDVAPSLLPSPPSGERVLVATDAGNHVFELAPAGAEEPLRETAGGQLQGGGQVQGGVRRAAAMPGIVVSSLGADDRSPYWQTRLAVPLAAEPIVDSTDGNGDGKITVATASGGIFQLDSRALASQTVADEPATLPPGSRWPVADVTRCGGTLALTCGAGSDRVTAVDLADPQHPSRTWLLPGPLSCRPIAFAGGLLAPSQVGQVFFLDPFSGKNLSEPFQPRLQPRRLPAWREPVAVGDREVVISDGHTKLYRLCVADPPAAHLEAAAERELPAPIVSPLAAVGKLVCGVDAAGNLDFFQQSDLARAGQVALAGRCAWGPRRIGDRAMLATDAGQLYCFDASGKQLWQAALAHGPLAGSPAAVGDHYLLAAAGGVVWRAEGTSGKELGRVDAGQPLATGPVLLGDRILVGGHDGSLHQLTPP